MYNSLCWFDESWIEWGELISLTRDCEFFTVLKWSQSLKVRPRAKEATDEAEEVEDEAEEEEVWK